MKETVITVESRYCDIDPMGVVNHAVYPVWCEIARINFLNSIGIDFSEFDKLGVSPAMVNLNMDFKSSVSFPATVTIRTHICDYSPKKIILRYELFSEGGTVPVNICTTTHVWVDGTMKSVNLKERYPEYFALVESAAK